MGRLYAYAEMNSGTQNLSSPLSLYTRFSDETEVAMTEPLMKRRHLEIIHSDDIDLPF